MREPDDDGAGGLELRDDRRVLRRHQFVARAREAFPPCRRHLAFDGRVGLDDNRHSPERTAGARRRRILTRGLGERLAAEHCFDRAVDAVVAIDAIEVPLHDLRDGVFLLGIQAMQIGHRHVQEIAIDRAGWSRRFRRGSTGQGEEDGHEREHEGTGRRHPQRIPLVVDGLVLI